LIKDKIDTKLYTKSTITKMIIKVNYLY